MSQDHLDTKSKDLIGVMDGDDTDRESDRTQNDLRIVYVGSELHRSIDKSMLTGKR